MRNLLKKNNNLHHSSDLDLQLLARRLIPHSCQAGCRAATERVGATVEECVAAAQLDKTKVLCLKYRPQWLCQYKDTKNQ